MNKLESLSKSPFRTDGIENSYGQMVDFVCTEVAARLTDACDSGEIYIPKEEIQATLDARELDFHFFLALKQGSGIQVTLNAVVAAGWVPKVIYKREIDTFYIAGKQLTQFLRLLDAPYTLSKFPASPYMANNLFKVATAIPPKSVVDTIYLETITSSLNSYPVTLFYDIDPNSHHGLYLQTEDYYVIQNRFYIP